MSIGKTVDNASEVTRMPTAREGNIAYYLEIIKTSAPRDLILSAIDKAHTELQDFNVTSIIAVKTDLNGVSRINVRAHSRIGDEKANDTAENDVATMVNRIVELISGKNSKELAIKPVELRGKLGCNPATGLEHS